MDNENVNIEEMLPKLLQALEAVTSKIDEMDARINELDSTIYDGLIGPANDAIAENEYNNALSDFRTKYAEKLGPFESVCKATEGDDFDVYKKAFDTYNEGGYEMEPDVYVDKLAEALTEQISKIKEAVAEEIGVDPSDVQVDVEATEDGKGNVEITTDVDDTTTEDTPSDNVEDKTDEDVVEEEEDPFSEEALRKELEKVDTKIRY